MEGRQDAILQRLKLRHKRVPVGMCEAVREVTEDERLSQLLLAAAQSTTLEQFSESL